MGGMRSTRCTSGAHIVAIRGGVLRIGRCTVSGLPSMVATSAADRTGGSAAAAWV